MVIMLALKIIQKQQYGNRIISYHKNERGKLENSIKRKKVQTEISQVYNESIQTSLCVIKNIFSARNKHTCCRKSAEDRYAHAASDIIDTF